MNGKEVVEAEVRGIRGQEGFHCYAVVVGISKIFRVRMRVHIEVKGTGERGKRVSIAYLVVVLGIRKIWGCI